MFTYGSGWCPVFAPSDRGSPVPPKSDTATILWDVTEASDFFVLGTMFLVLFLHTRLFEPEASLGGASGSLNESS